MKKIKTVLLIVVVSIAIVFGVIGLRTAFPPVLSQDETERDFIKNQDIILIVTNYMIGLEYTNVYINKGSTEGVMFVNSVGFVDIDDSQVVNAISLLQKKGYSVIIKKENTIHFQRSTKFRDFGSGVAYSIDGGEPQLHTFTMVEPLSEPNWYYYEQDYRERIEQEVKSASDFQGLPLEE